MKSNLIVNPLASIDTDASGELISGGPVPGRGIKYLHVSASNHPNLYSVFQELSDIGLGHLNIETDLKDGEADLLLEHGILIEPDNMPERPLFACMLDDVEGSGSTIESRIVNPTLEFRPFDLTKFRMMSEKHLSPHFASVWVTDPLTEMRWGYWLSRDEAQVIERLRPGTVFSEGIDEPTVSKLVSARILIDRQARPQSIGDKARDFAENRYVVIDQVIPAAQFRALRSYYRQYVEQGFMKFGDTFVERRFSEHGEQIAFMILNNLTTLMSKIAAAQVQPTYSHSAVYVEGADLEPHIDREACEFSFSFQLDYLPEPEDGVSPWPLYLSVNPPDDLRVDPKVDRAICLANGSCLAYRGRELVHYRTPLPEGHRSTSLFFHYIPA